MSVAEKRRQQGLVHTIVGDKVVVTSDALMEMLPMGLEGLLVGESTRGWAFCGHRTIHAAAFKPVWWSNEAKFIQQLGQPTQSQLVFLFLAIFQW